MSERNAIVIVLTWSNMSNVIFEPEKVAAAEAEDIICFEKPGVYRRAPRAMITQVGGKLVTVKWLETNKGYRDFPHYRLRLATR